MNTISHLGFGWTHFIHFCLLGSLNDDVVLSIIDSSLFWVVDYFFL